MTQESIRNRKKRLPAPVLTVGQGGGGGDDGQASDLDAHSAGEGAAGHRCRQRIDLRSKGQVARKKVA